MKSPKKANKSKSKNKSNILKNTRFKQLGYRKEAPGQWSIYDKETQGSIGGKYTTEKELLADLNRFAKERGYDQ